MKHDVVAFAMFLSQGKNAANLGTSNFVEAAKKWTAEDTARQLGVVSATTGLDLIADERSRQVEVEGWTPGHDDQHDKGQLAAAAQCYAYAAFRQAVCGRAPSIPNPSWPWDMKWWKPSPDPVRNLVKAGALIAAELDRILRLRECEESRNK